jgi:hypothetical protein
LFIECDQCSVTLSETLYETPFTMWRLYQSYSHTSRRHIGVNLTVKCPESQLANMELLIAKEGLIRKLKSGLLVLLVVDYANLDL